MHIKGLKCTLEKIEAKLCGYSCELRSLGANVKTTENSGTKVTKLEFSMGLDNIIKRFGVDLVGCFSVYKAFGRFENYQKCEGPKVQIRRSQL